MFEFEYSKMAFSTYSGSNVQNIVFFQIRLFETCEHPKRFEYSKTVREQNYYERGS